MLRVHMRVCDSVSRFLWREIVPSSPPPQCYSDPFHLNNIIMFKLNKLIGEHIEATSFRNNYEMINKEFTPLLHG